MFLCCMSHKGLSDLSGHLKAFWDVFLRSEPRRGLAVGMGRAVGEGRDVIGSPWGLDGFEAAILLLGSEDSAADDFVFGDDDGAVDLCGRMVEWDDFEGGVV